ncbi:MAG: AAA family ATPase [Candidatus Peribacteria bacterium]|nr:MAG: AAA family ATPase [Candidatus Peribacteria bacterium]USN58933.1 MAG: AAA family ATPase [Candidatus Peribacteria bacterium]
MTNNFYDIIFIAGAPGTGKSSVAKSLQEKLNCPCFEFGWIPEFRNKGIETISYEEDETIAFENLSLVAKNYIKHGFKNIIITDLEDKRIKELHTVFQQENYILFTLTVSDDEILKSRVLDETRSSGYRDFESAIKISNEINSRELLPNEIRIDATNQSVENVVKIITAKLFLQRP